MVSTAFVRFVASVIDRFTPGAKMVVVSSPGHIFEKSLPPTGTFSFDGLLASRRFINDVVSSPETRVLGNPCSSSVSFVCYSTSLSQSPSVYLLGHGC